MAFLYHLNRFTLAFLTVVQTVEMSSGNLKGLNNYAVDDNEHFIDETEVNLFISSACCHFKTDGQGLNADETV